MSVSGSGVHPSNELFSLPCSRPRLRFVTPDQPSCDQKFRNRPQHASTRSSVSMSNALSQRAATIANTDNFGVRTSCQSLLSNALSAALSFGFAPFHLGAKFPHYHFCLVSYWFCLGDCHVTGFDVLDNGNNAARTPSTVSSFSLNLRIFAVSFVACHFIFGRDATSFLVGIKRTVTVRMKTMPTIMRTTTPIM